jgi:hypothetical protein
MSKVPWILIRNIPSKHGYLINNVFDFVVALIRSRLPVIMKSRSGGGNSNFMTEAAAAAATSNGGPLQQLPPQQLPPIPPPSPHACKYNVLIHFVLSLQE